MPISFLFYLHNGLNFSDFILFQSIFNITCLVAKIPMGFLGDIFSKKSMLIISYFLFMLRVILWIFFSGFYIVLAGEILYGLFKALYRGNVDSYIYDWLKKNNVEQNILPRYGKLSFWTSMGSALSCFVGVILYKAFGFRSILCIELILQIFALSLLFFIPNIKSKTVKKKSKKYFRALGVSVIRITRNVKVNYYVYYSAILTGLTGVFVWNFQPLLKASSAPIILFGIVSFVNQTLRGVGGLFAKQFTAKWHSKKLINIEYIATLCSFLLILSAYQMKNYIFISGVILTICLAICLFVIFNIYTVSKIHENTNDFNRATTSSTNTFFGDFASFFFLLSFKYLYDLCGITITLATFFILFSVLLFPRNKFLNKSV